MKKRMKSRKFTKVFFVLFGYTITWFYLWDLESKHKIVNKNLKRI